MTGRASDAAWIVVIPANAPSGVAEIVGPFDSFKEAEEYAHGDDQPVGTWWTTLTPPKEAI